MRTRFIDKFDVILLDMGRTFMFDVDRFSDREDFGATYRQLGGSALSGTDVRRIISALFYKMLSESRNPERYDLFPQVSNCLSAIPEARNLPASEVKLLEQVFAMHEIGTVSELYAESLCELRRTHRLGIVSDIWSRSGLYFTEFDRAGIRELFEVIIFSSDHDRIKPSPYLFAKAIEALNVESSRIVYVGASLRRDIAGAKAAGLSAVWVDTGAVEIDEALPSPYLVIRDLRDLLDR